MPRQPQPVAADVKALYVDNCLRRLARVLVDGGEDNLAALGRSWPQLADELEALAATPALPVREAQTSQPATRGATEGCAPAPRER